MTLEEAITTALNYETKARDHYRDNANRLEDPKGRAFFQLLAKEEEGHVAWLQQSLDEPAAEDVIVALPCIGKAYGND